MSAGSFHGTSPRATASGQLSPPHSALAKTQESSSAAGLGSEDGTYSRNSKEGKEAAKKAKRALEMEEMEKVKWHKGQKKQAMMFRQKAQQCLCLDRLAATGEQTRRDIFRQVLLKQKNNSKGCLTLPVSIAFVALFCIAARLHEDITNVYLLESAFRNVFTPGLQNLETLDDMWNWIDGGGSQPSTPGTDLINTIFSQVDDYGEPLPPKDWSRFLHYTRFEGAVILKQYRDSSKPFGKVLSQNLSTWAVAANATREGFISVAQVQHGRRLADLYRPEFQDSVPLPSTDDNAFEFRLFPSMSIEEIRARIAYLKACQWLDLHTEVLEVSALALNGELGRPRLEQMKLKVMLSRGGQVYWQITMNTLFLEVFPPGMMSKAFDGLWLFVLLLSIWIELRNFITQFVNEKLYSHVTKPTTSLELIILGVGSLYFVFLAMMILRTDALNEKLEAVIKTGYGSPMSDQERASRELNDKADDFNVLMSQFRLLLSWYCIILIFRFFIAFRVQPRLAVVTNTLIAVTEDLIHFLFISLPCFLAYMVAGNLLFGRRMEEFSSLRASCGTMFRMLYESEYRWEVLSEEHFSTAAVWVWTYLIFVVFIMLNLVLAIILDTYNEVRMNTDSADTIFVFFGLTMKRLWNYRRWISNDQLQGLLTEMDAETTVNRDELRSIVPLMTHCQSDVIFQATQKEMHWKAKADLRRPEMFKLAASLRNQMHEAEQVIGDVLKSQAGGVEVMSEASTEPHADALHMALRQRGHSRPFPGMQDTPGGYNPPLLSPESLQGNQPNGAIPPVWFQDLRRHTEQLNTWMVALQWQMSCLQWKFIRAHQLVDSDASEYSSRDGSPMREATSKHKSSDGTSHWSGLSWNGPLKTKSGAWLL